jgi:hypothetical protein
MTARPSTVRRVSSTAAVVAITSVATLSAAAISAFASQAAVRVTARADREQLQARLRHERQVHDVDELRGILDEAAETIRGVRNTVARPPGPGWIEDGTAALEPLEARLAIRLGEDNRVTEAVAAVLEALATIQQHYELNAQGMASEEDEDEFWATLDALRDDVSQQADEFFSAARSVAGARLAMPTSEAS